VQAVRKALSESQIREFCDWLEIINPSPHHDEALKLYEKGTCDWSFRFKEWEDLVGFQKRCLWIHGIPGTGKTVLAAYLISHLQAMCRAETPSNACSIYYYCDYVHEQDEAPAFLSWLISQLCQGTQSIPEQAFALFSARRATESRELLDALQQALTLVEFQHVFVVLDGIDASLGTERLLRVIDRIVTDQCFNKIQLLVTSKQFPWIEQAMKKICVFVHSVSMQNPLVEADIQLFIQGRMANWQGSKRIWAWPEAIRFARKLDAETTR
jgi:Cdc6-like AAA superfamily ATPase